MFETTNTRKLPSGTMKTWQVHVWILNFQSLDSSSSTFELLEIAALEGSFLRHPWCKKPALWYTSKAACPAYCAWKQIGGSHASFEWQLHYPFPAFWREKRKSGFILTIVVCMPTSYWDNEYGLHGSWILSHLQEIYPNDLLRHHQPLSEWGTPKKMFMEKHANWAVSCQKTH